MAPKFVAAARAQTWKVAYDECNGLPMYAMLDGLQEIGPALLQDMRSQMAIFNVWGGPNMPRIGFAMDVVTSRKVPPNTAGLFPDQITDAEKFLARTSGGAAPAKRTLCITLFWTEAAQGEIVSSRYVQRARELLRDNHTNIDLDVAPYRGEIAIPGEIGDNSEMDKAMALARVAPLYAGNRLAVIFHLATASQCDHDKQMCAGMNYGNTPDSGNGRFVFINVAGASSDGATLLHEMGHAAGVQSRDSDRNLKDSDDVMSYGTTRTKIGFNQLNLFRRQNLFFAR